jgi:hypothetical protein
MIARYLAALHLGRVGEQMPVWRKSLLERTLMDCMALASNTPPQAMRHSQMPVHQDFAYLSKWLGGPTNLQRGERPPWCFLTKGAGVQTGRHRVLLLWSHICSACHVLQLRRGAGVQKFATARWLVNACQSTPTVHIRKGNPSASAKPKVRDNRTNPDAVFSSRSPRHRPDRHNRCFLGLVSTLPP